MMQTATNQQRVAYSTIVQIAGRVVTAGLGIFIVGLSTRYLGLSGYGQLTTAIIFTTVFMTFGEAGTSSITVRELLQSKRNPKDIIGNILVLRLLLALIGGILCLLAGNALYQGPENSQIREAIYLLVITLFLTTIQGALTAPLIAKVRNGFLVVGSILGKVATLVLIIVAIKYNLGFKAIVLATLAGAVINFTCDIAFGLKATLPRFRIDLKYWKYILIIAVPMAAVSVLNTFYFRVDGLMLSLYKGSTEVALYGVAYKISEITMVFPIIFIGAVFPLMASSLDKQRVAFLTEKAVGILQIAAPAIVVGVIIISSEIAILLGGSNFSDAATPMSILIISNYFIFSNSAYSSALIALNHQKKLLWVVFVTLLINIGFNLVAIPLAGAAGAAAGVCVAEIMGFWLLKFYYRRYVGTPPSMKQALPSIISAVIMGAGVFGMKFVLAPLTDPNLLIFILVMAGAGMYGAILLLTGQVKLSMLKELSIVR